MNAGANVTDERDGMERRKGTERRHDWWRSLWRSKARVLLVALLGGGTLAGVVLSGTALSTLHVTNTMGFCLSCHEMERNVFRGEEESPHYVNRTGVPTICSDCHVPEGFGHMLIAKLAAAKDVYHKLVGTIDSPEKFEARRLTMAQRVWAKMKATDSRECRGCHDIRRMDFTAQNGRAARKHQASMENGDTCIDCHKGVVHKLPDGHDEQLRLASD
jgi:nitrate/TMAO reductase-like tetraheme cytochrome c subunit